MLGEFKIGGGGRGAERRVKCAAEIDRRRAAIAHTERVLRHGFPLDAGSVADVGAFPAQAGLQERTQWEQRLLKFRVRVIDRRPRRNRKRRVRFPRDDRRERVVNHLALRGAKRRAAVGPLHAESVGRERTEAEGDGRGFQSSGEIKIRNTLEFVFRFRLRPGRVGFVGGRQADRVKIRAGLRAFELADTGGIVVNRRGVVGGRREGVAARGGLGVLIGDAQPERHRGKGKKSPGQNRQRNSWSHRFAN